MNALLAILVLTAQAQRPALPEFTPGDQCLFCHRNDIGPAWQKNRHNLTVQPKEGSTTAFTLGSRQQTRRLTKTGYGKFAISEAAGPDHASKFNDRCAGCHTTAVNGETRAFTEFGIDCYACHGVVDLEHSNDTSKILLSKKQRTSAAVVISICGSCHLRGGVSKAKGFPYALHFVPGDDLFTDFQFDAALAADGKLNAGDRHVYRNVVEVRAGATETTCLSCHSVHGGNSQKHRRVLTSAACVDCHMETGPKKVVKPYSSGHALCETN